MSNFKFVIGGGWTWSLSYIWSLLPSSVIVYLWDCLNVFWVSLRSSCLFVCLSAGVYVACGSSWPVCLNVCLCPLDQVCLFVSIRSIWLDLSWGTTKQRCRGESCHHLIFRVQLGGLFCRRLNTGAFHQSTAIYLMVSLPRSRCWSSVFSFYSIHSSWAWQRICTERRSHTKEGCVDCKSNMQVLREGFKSNEDSYLEQQGLVRVESLLQSIFPIHVDLKAQRNVCQPSVTNHQSCSISYQVLQLLVWLGGWRSSGLLPQVLSTTTSTTTQGGWRSSSLLHQVLSTTGWVAEEVAVYCLKNKVLLLLLLHMVGWRSSSLLPQVLSTAMATTTPGWLKKRLVTST